MGPEDGAGTRAENDAMLHLVAALASRERPAVVLSGAGISVSSEIPAFRDSDGLWARYDPMEYATIEAFWADPEKVWQMLWELDAVLEAAEPNPAHHAIAQLQRLGVLATVITQNVDALHQAAGTRDVVELHGSRRSLSCLGCGRARSRDEMVAETRRGEVPRCRACDGWLKPDVVFFGEQLPAEALHRAERAVRGCDDLLVVGTAAEVTPAASLPGIARGAGARIWEINPEPALREAEHIMRPAQLALPELVDRLRERRKGDTDGDPG